MTATPHFKSLDALRGVAALGVVLFHVGSFFGYPHIFPHGYLAVDFFFLLSGFVVANAYADKLQSRRLALGTFIKIRLIRLLPLSVAGALLGITVAVIAPNLSPVSQALLPIAAVANISLLPLMPLVATDGTLFPLNDPEWSLFFELVANFLYAPAVRLIQGAALAVLSVAAAIATVAFLRGPHGIDLGSHIQGWPLGFIRVAISFLLGIVIFRLHRLGRLPMLRLPTWAIGLALAAILFVPGFTPTIRIIFDLVCVLVVFPVLIILGTASSTASAYEVVAGWLGDVSYPVYALHYPLVVAVAGVWHEHKSGLPRPVAVGLLLVALCVCAHFAFKIDVAVRKRLMRGTVAQQRTA